MAEEERAADVQRGATVRRRYRSPRDVWLAVAAIPVAATAQRAREVPLPELVGILRRRPAPAPPDTARALTAASRAVRLWRRLTGSLDSCLIRSLVAGRLLAPRHDVRLVLGFRPAGAADQPDGHAWLEVDGKTVQVNAPPDGPPYEAATTIPFPAGQSEGRR